MSIRWLTVGLLALALAGCAGSGADSKADSAVDAAPDTGGPPPPVLTDPAYRFCHVPGADAEEAREYCELLDGLPEDRCPGLRATCDKGAKESILTPGGCNGMDGGTPGSTPAPPPKKPKEPFEIDLKPFSCHTPDSLSGWFGALLRWGGAMMVALLVLVVLRLIVAAIRWGRREEEAPATPDRPVGVVEVSADEVPDLPVQDLLAAASQALGKGRWADAVLLARGAVLRRLGDAGRLRLHRSRTDREYLRQVRRDEAVHEPLGEVLRAVEQHRWGGVEVGEAMARQAFAAARRLVQVVGVVMLLVFVAGAADDWRYGPQGDAALYTLLVDHGYSVSWRLRGLTDLGDDTDVLLVDLSGITPTDADWQAMRAWVQEGHVLWLSGEVEDGFPEVGTPVGLPAGTGVHLADVLVPWMPAPRWPQGPVAGWKDPSGVSWVLGGESESAVNARLKAGQQDLVPPPTTVVEVLYLGKGAVLAVSDARLLYNGAMVSPDNEEFVGEILHTGEALDAWRGQDPLRVQLATAAAAGSSNPVGSLANARLLPFVLQLLALMALAALWKGWPFAPLRDPPEEGRLRFADHVRALGARYARLRASRHATASYAGLWLARLGPAGIEEAARHAGRSPEEARAMVEAVERAAGDPTGASSTTRDFELMEELWRITKHG